MMDRLDWLARTCRVLGTWSIPCSGMFTTPRLLRQTWREYTQWFERRISQCRCYLMKGKMIYIWLMSCSGNVIAISIIPSSPLLSTDFHKQPWHQQLHQACFRPQPLLHQKQHACMSHQIRTDGCHTKRVMLITHTILLLQRLCSSPSSSPCHLSHTLRKLQYIKSGNCAGLW